MLNLSGKRVGAEVLRLSKKERNERERMLLVFHSMNLEAIIKI
jgi:hypothetical protein